MFLVGLDFRADDFKSNARGALAVAVSGIVVPFIVAVLVTPWLNDGAPGYSRPACPASTPPCSWERRSPSPHSRCWRASSTIEAWPGLRSPRRGLVRRGPSVTRWPGAWSPVVLAGHGAGAGIAVVAIAGGALLAAALILLGPPPVFAPGPARRTAASRRPATQPDGAGRVTDVVHAVSLSIGRHRTARGVRRIPHRHGHAAWRVRPARAPVARALHAGIPCCPVFFTYSGLNTRLGMVDTPQLLRIAARHPRRVHLREIHRLLAGGACRRAEQSQRARPRRIDERARPSPSSSSSTSACRPVSSARRCSRCWCSWPSSPHSWPRRCSSWCTAAGRARWAKSVQSILAADPQ